MKTLQNPICIDSLLIQTINGFNVKKNQDLIIQSKDSLSCYNFAKYVKNADVKSLEQVILNNKDHWYACAFAIDILGSNIQALEEIVLQAKDPHCCLKFAKNVVGANIKAHEEIIIASKNSYCCYYFAINSDDYNGFDDLNINALQQVLIENKSYKHIIAFARDNKANKQLLSEVILQSLDQYWIEEFYNNIDFDKSRYELMMLFK